MSEPTPRQQAQERLKELIALNPDKLVAISKDRAITNAQLEERSTRLAKALYNLGLRPGDRAAVMIYNQPEYFEIGAALLLIGVGRVMVGYRSKSPEIEYIAENSDAKCLIFNYEFAERILPRRDRYRGLLKDGFICIGATSHQGSMDYEDLIQNAPDINLNNLPEVSGESMIYTSGTTGKPKGATRKPKESGQADHLLSVVTGFNFTENEVHLVSCPLYHSAPFLFTGVARILNGTIVLMQRFDPMEFLENIDRYKVTSAFVVPTILDSLLKIPKEEVTHLDLSSMRTLICGGAPLFPKVKLAILDWLGPVLYEFYGSTETGVNTLLTPGEMRQHPDSVGKPFADNELIILDDKGNEVKDGERGVLYIYNNILIDGYYKNEKASREVHHDKYITVGDVAIRDREGYYYIVDRVTDMIIRGGVNIYPAEIEEILHRMPGIQDVAVVGKPDPHWGEVVAAFIVPEKASKINEDSIKAYCIEQMSNYKIPGLIYFRDEIPRNPAGKIMKKELRKELVTD